MFFVHSDFYSRSSCDNSCVYILLKVIRIEGFLPRSLDYFSSNTFIQKIILESPFLDFLDRILNKLLLMHRENLKLVYKNNIDPHRNIVYIYNRLYSEYFLTLNYISNNI